MLHFSCPENCAKKLSPLDVYMTTPTCCPHTVWKTSTNGTSRPLQRSKHLKDCIELRTKHVHQCTTAYPSIDLSMQKFGLYVLSVCCRGFGRAWRPTILALGSSCNAEASLLLFSQDARRHEMNTVHVSIATLLLRNLQATAGNARPSPK